jgi:beta-phosphoglucomutase-like phosphatase (HAD superfamily)
MRRFELVIFDCDGVLVDSELIINRVFGGLPGELGLPVSLEFLFENFVGRSMQHCWEQVAEMLGKEVPAHWQSELQLRTTAALEAAVQAVHGIEAVLDALEVPARSSTACSRLALITRSTVWPSFTRCSAARILKRDEVEPWHIRGDRLDRRRSPAVQH